MNKDEKALTVLHENFSERAFAQFVKATPAMIHSWGMYLLRRWPAGEAVDIDDVEQELLAGIFRYVPLWDPARGASLMKYVRFNAMADCKRQLHRMRGNRADSRSDRLAARIARPMADPSAIDRMLKVEPEQDESGNEEARAVKLRSLADRTADPIMRTCIAALARYNGDIDAAAVALHRGLHTRRLLSAIDLNDVRSEVLRAIRTVADTNARASRPSDAFLGYEIN